MNLHNFFYTLFYPNNVLAYFHSLFEVNVLFSYKMHLPLNRELNDCLIINFKIQLIWNNFKNVEPIRWKLVG